LDSIHRAAWPLSDEAAGRMIPANQGFKTRHLAAAQIDDRLVIHLELAGEQRLAQIELERVMRLHLRIHFGLEEMMRAAPFALGAIERHVGVAQQLVGLFAVGRRDRDADADADHHLLAGNIERLGNRRDDAAGEFARLRRPGAHLDNGEFVATKARNRVGAANGSLQALGHRA